MLTAPQVLLFLSLNMIYQGLGKEICYYGYFYSMYAACFTQSQSFFVALFRYLCIVKNDYLTTIGVPAKVNIEKQY
jgi:hypothetical protein